MITASLVIYKTKHEELHNILTCCVNSIIDKVFVVDNSPTDELAAIVLGYNSIKLEYIWGQGNVGFGHANNIGIKNSICLGSQYHIILNPDIIFRASAIEKMTCFMDNHEDVCMMTPLLTYPDGTPQTTAMMLPRPYDMFGRRLLPKFFTDKINKHYELKSCDLTRSREVPNICGCFMYCRTQVLEKVGLFDETFFMYFEDFDLVRRVHKVGKVVIFPMVSIIHAHAAEHRKSKFLLKESIKSAIKYFNKWGWFFDADRRFWNKKVYSDSSLIEN